MLSKGITVLDIATIQSFYMLANILFEFPSGILADIFGRKKVYIISLLFLIISYMAIVFSNSVFTLAICWFLYGIGMSMFSGTINTDIIVYLKENKYDFKHFQVYDKYISSFSSILGAFFGSILYSIIDIGMYYLAVLCFIILLFLIMNYSSIKNNDLIQNDEKFKLKENFANVLSNTLKMFKNREFVYIFILVSLTPIYLQMFYQYWQILYEAKGINYSLFGVVYFLIHISNIVGTYIYKKFNEKINIKLFI